MEIPRRAKNDRREKGDRKEMHELSIADSPRTEADMPTDLLAGLLMERARQPRVTAASPDTLPPKVYGVMAVTTLLTFATLATGYQALFTHSVFA
jgi:hypothetical protein